jgi:general secretion pathway protein D
MTLRPPATASTIPDPDTIFAPLSINLSAAPLEKVIEMYADFVGRNLLRPATLPKAEIVLKQTTALTKLELVRMIEAALYLNQISVVNVGDKFVTVVLNTEAYKIPGVLNTNAYSAYPPLGSMATHVVQLKFTKPSEMVQVLAQFASGTSAQPIMPVDSSGILVLRDNVANVKRMLEMIEKVDVRAESEIISEVIPIKYAKAEEIASALSSVGGGTAGSVGTRSSSSTRSTGAAGGLNRPGTLGQQPGAYGQQPGATGLPGSTPTPSSNATFGDRVRNLISKAAGSGDFSILGETKIIADIRSNSLLVFASRQDMEMIKDIIAKLDVVLAQVLIETIIMDVSFGNEFSVGVTAGQAPRTKGDIRSGGFYNNMASLAR